MNAPDALPTLAVVNFAALHLLHMQPVREWFDALSPDAHRRCLPAVNCADFRGALHLEHWLESDLAGYRVRLGLGATLVLATPTSICTDKFYGPYAKWQALHASSRLAPCVEWASHRPNVSVSEATQVCERFTFTEVGAASLTDRFLAAAQRVPGVIVLDVHHLTAGRCNDTHDGRHYPSLLPREVAELERVAALGSVSTAPQNGATAPLPESPPGHPLVINLGVAKSGTTSLHEYFLCNGWRSVHDVGCGRPLERCASKLTSFMARWHPCAEVPWQVAARNLEPWTSTCAW
eukprot:7383959-Prymnesium_polylepis.1